MLRDADPLGLLEAWSKVRTEVWAETEARDIVHLLVLSQVGAVRKCFATLQADKGLLTLRSGPPDG